MVELIWLLEAVVVAAIVYWLIGLLPIDPRFKQVALILLVLILLVWAVTTLPVFHHMGRSP